MREIIFFIVLFGGGALNMIAWVCFRKPDAPLFDAPRIPWPFGKYMTPLGVKLFVAGYLLMFAAMALALLGFVRLNDVP